MLRLKDTLPSASHAVMHHVLDSEGKVQPWVRCRVFVASSCFHLEPASSRHIQRQTSDYAHENVLVLSPASDQGHC